MYGTVLRQPEGRSRSLPILIYLENELMGEWRAKERQPGGGGCFKKEQEGVCVLCRARDAIQYPPGWASIEVQLMAIPARKAAELHPVASGQLGSGLRNITKVCNVRSSRCAQGPSLTEP